MGSTDADVDLPADAQDTISSVSWSPTNPYLAAASWDGHVRVYNVGPAPDHAYRGPAVLQTQRPLLGCHWARDGSLVAAGGTDCKLYILDPVTGQHDTSSDEHAAPIKAVRFVDIPGAGGGGSSIVASGSWDQTVKLWDLRQHGQVMSVPCTERVYAMDAAEHLLVVATADNTQVDLFDFRNPSAGVTTVDSALQHQAKAIAVYPDALGWATAGIEGCVAITDLEDEAERFRYSPLDTGSFTFECHQRREVRAGVWTTEIWSVNDLCFHPIDQNVLATAGSDGSFCFWDTGTGDKLREYEPGRDSHSAGGSSGGHQANITPITAAAFDHDGGIFSYAMGYDWSMGHAHNSSDIRNRLVLHTVTEDDIPLEDDASLEDEH
ncbi:WD40 repeat-like protein [Durotheca rogersii]|uniref:WD40 repeat-like protein n=1 Tax=Durotheca rogersii TaxID=419775 RepID=UPI00221E3846|nr:WD40 repeat-like protein [Durotheca rogersii]KAI5863222.1 WD40 repeat-like protein [Durotheca rogersii]